MAMKKRVSAYPAVLGEGPCLVAKEHLALWVDINGNKVFSKRLNTSGTIKELSLLKPSQVFYIQTKGFLVSHARGLDQISPDLEYRREVVSWFKNDEDLRSNDGCSTIDSGLWMSTMSDSHVQGRGAIWHWDFQTKPKLLIDNLTIPNSLAFDRKRRRLYFADSIEQTIYFVEISDSFKAAKEAKLHFKLDKGVPDGSALDCAGNLWTACWDGFCIIKTSPSGEFMEKIEVPFSRPTSIDFAPTGNQALITSAKVQGQKESGHTFLYDIK